MENLLFPHDNIRPVQKALTIQIYNTIKNKQNLIAHAPTGLGKTASSLSAAVTYALENNKTVFFLTPMHTQHMIAVDTLKKIKHKYNKDLVSIDLIGKKWMCLQPGVQDMQSQEFSEYCKEITKKKECEYFENFKDKTQKQNCFSQIKEPSHVEELISISRKCKLCPFEVTTELGKKATVIVADYYHILHPSIRATLLERMNKKLENSIIIFDEAHSLIQKCRDILSWNLSTITIERAIRESKDFNFGYENDLEKLRVQLEKINKSTQISETEKLVSKDDFKFDPDLVANLKLASDLVLEERKRSNLFTIYNFMQAWLQTGKEFVRIFQKAYTKQGKPFQLLTYSCLDPSLIFNQIPAHSKILMSGTLIPQEMYRDLLKLDPKDTILAEYNNPFPKDNRRNLIVPGISTKYDQRSDEMFQKIAYLTSEITNKVPGNSIIFFPSYELRDKVSEYFKKRCNKTIFLESNKMSKSEKTELIEKFKSYKTNGAVILGAASGSLGTGLDLPGDLLKCVVVVGLPLAKPNLETKELISYYDHLFKRGWDYAYIYPAIIQSLQNAGRCIRSPTDKGVIVFLDERYAWKNYKSCFPPDSNFEVTTVPLQKIEEFFNPKV